MQRIVYKYILLLLLCAVILSLITYNDRPKNAVDFVENSVDLTSTSFSPLQLNEIKIESKVWFLHSPMVFTSVNRSTLAIFPGDAPQSDRITNQLMYIPANYTKHIHVNQYKTICLLDGISQFPGVDFGAQSFRHCPVSTCKIVNDEHADLVIAKLRSFTKRHADQLSMVYILESPQHTDIYGNYDLTATYRLDSDIVAPYGKFVHYNDQVRTVINTTTAKDYAGTKTKMIAWFVSNCATSNGRLQVARELQQYIEVDIYGACGNLKCPRMREAECFKRLKRDYKFYLSFENSNCKHYITEKFFINALQNDVVPIVMGGRREDYEQLAPRNSFIHIDDFGSVKELAEYLKHLDEDDVAYNKYFRWKGTGELINTHFWCRVCAILHAPVNGNERKLSLYNKTFNDWWAGADVCW